MIRQEILGTYSISQVFFDEHERMREVLAPEAQPPPAAFRPTSRGARARTQPQPCTQLQTRPVHRFPTPTRPVGPTTQTTMCQYLA